MVNPGLKPSHRQLIQYMKTQTCDKAIEILKLAEKIKLKSVFKNRVLANVFSSSSQTFAEIQADN